MTTEFDLGCATCGGSLRETTVAADTLGFEVTAPVSVAECTECGGRHFPERALDQLWNGPSGHPGT